MSDKEKTEVKPAGSGTLVIVLLLFVGFTLGFAVGFAAKDTIVSTLAGFVHSDMVPAPRRSQPSTPETTTETGLTETGVPVTGEEEKDEPEKSENDEANQLPPLPE